VSSTGWCTVIEQKLIVIDDTVVSWDESSSDEDDVFLDIKQKAESVSSVSRDGWDDDEEVAPCLLQDQLGVRLEVIDGRAVILTDKRVVETRSESPGRRAEDEICRMRSMGLGDENKRLEDENKRLTYLLRCERDASKKRQVPGGGSVITGKRRKSSEDVWFTTLAAVSLDEARSRLDSEEKEVFVVDEGLEELFDEFIEDIEYET